jgi:hypothetical protein
VQEMSLPNSRRMHSDSIASISNVTEMQQFNSRKMRYNCKVPTFGMEEIPIPNSRRMHCDSRASTSGLEEMQPPNSRRMP